jgi:hypothetical protein
MAGAGGTALAAARPAAGVAGGHSVIVLEAHERP